MSGRVILNGVRENGSIWVQVLVGGQVTPKVKINALANHKLSISTHYKPVIDDKLGGYSSGLCVVVVYSHTDSVIF